MALQGNIFSKSVLKIKSEWNLPVLNADELNEYDAVFMTGTSPMVLPFYCIDNYFFNVRIPWLKS
jgi:hypothetical protein